MSNIDDAIREAVELFVVQLKDLMQRAALESVQAALNGGTPAARRRTKAASSSAPSLGYDTSSKRSPAEIAALNKKLHAYIAKHPGLRIEKIGAGLGVPTKALVLPVKRLIGDKKLSRKGQKRATVYFAH